MAALADWRSSMLYTDSERVALEYGQRMPITGQSVDDAFYAQLAQHFDDAQIVELTASIAMENFRSKFNVPLQVEAQGFCPLPNNPAG